MQKLKPQIQLSLFAFLNGQNNFNSDKKLYAVDIGSKKPINSSIGVQKEIKKSVPKKEYKMNFDNIHSSPASSKETEVKIEVDYNISLKNCSNKYFQLTEDQKQKIQELNGNKNTEVGQISSISQREKGGPCYYQAFDASESEDSQYPPKQQIKLQDFEDQIDQYQKQQYLPLDLAKLLNNKQIPLEYVRGLLLIKNLKQIKSIRRLKVQRYLQKRRNKTWNRKICYNCRQKVAEQRLRIKGKFIKKRRAMEILGIVKPCTLNELKRGLEKLLRNKNRYEIDQIIKTQE